MRLTLDDEGAWIESMHYARDILLGVTDLDRAVTRPPRPIPASNKTLRERR